MTRISAFRTAASLLRPKVNCSPCVNYHPSRINIHSPTRSAHNSVASRQHPKDEKIKHNIVQLVDPETGRLTPPTTMEEILASIDRKRQFVELVSVDHGAVVKIINKKEAFEKRKQQKVRAKENAKKNTQKEVQLTWGVAAGDLTHKLNKVRQALEKGSKVDLVFAPKKGQPLPTPTEMRKRAQETVDSLADVGKEWKAMEFQRTVVAIFLQGTITQNDALQIDTKQNTPDLEQD
jgi:translation initiation factor IF-3